MNLALRDDLYFCLTDRGAVFLDLAANRYFGLNDRADTAFRRIVSGDGLDPSLEKDLRPLLSSGALYPAESLKALSAPRTDEPVLSRCGDAERSAVPFATALLAHLSVRIEMKMVGLKGMVRRREARKREAAATEPETLPPEVDRILAAHRKVDRLLGETDRCLPRALCLIDHLARVKVFPDLIIGVRTGSFAAHCWVQHGETILNDEIDRVRLFTPILVL